MNLMISNNEYGNGKLENIKSTIYNNISFFRVEFQPQNGKGGSFWIFIVPKQGKPYAVEYNPGHEDLFVY